MTYTFSDKAGPFCAKFVDAFDDAGIDIGKIHTWNEFKSSIVTAGKNLNCGTKGQDYKDFSGKIAFPLFVEFLVNCKLFTNTLGLHNFKSGWDLPGDDHGVDGICNLVIDSNDLCTAQLKFIDNPTTPIDRNQHHAGNFYESSREDYGIDDRGRMVWFTTSTIQMNKNMKDYTRHVNGLLYPKLTDNRKNDFWTPFFSAICLSAKSVRVNRPGAGSTVNIYSPSQIQMFNHLLRVDYEQTLINAGCGGAKSEGIGMKCGATFARHPGAINAVCGPRLDLLGELSDRFHQAYSSLPYTEASFSSKKDWEKTNFIVGENSNKKIFSNTKLHKWITFLEEEVQPYPHRNFIWYVCYASYENFAKMLSEVKAEKPLLWKDISCRFEGLFLDEAHNLSPTEKLMQDPEEDRRLKRIITTYHPFLKTVFKQTIGATATVTEYMLSHPEIYGNPDITINQLTLQKEGVTVPLIPNVVTSDDTILNASTEEDDKDLSYFTYCIDKSIERCLVTGVTPKLSIWTKSAIITRYFEDKLQEKYPHAIVERMTANTPPKERHEIKNKYKSSNVLSIILNYDIISEGSNLQGTTDCIVGRNLGQIKIVQIGGRPVRLHLEDRASLRDGKIQPLDPDGWIKPDGHIWFYNETDSMESTEYTEATIEFIHQLNLAGSIKVEDTKFHKKPKGLVDPTTENVMEDPEEPSPKLEQIFIDRLKTLQYNATIRKSFNLLSLVEDDKEYANRLLALFRT